jgi:hypothetical protein
MSAEYLIREKHRIESEVSELQISLRKWQQSFALLSNQEIELAAAKVLDRTLENPVDRSMRLKLLTLSATLKRRSIGYRVSAFKRFWLITDPQLLIERFMAETLHIPVALDDEALRLLAQSEQR